MTKVTKLELADQLVDGIENRRAKPRLDANHADLLALAKAEKIAMEEVRCGLVAYTPESSLAP